MLLLNKCQRGYFSKDSNTLVYFTFDLTLETPNLIVPYYSEYQEFLNETISDLREKGWNFQQIAETVGINRGAVQRIPQVA